MKMYGYLMLVSMRIAYRRNLVLNLTNRTKNTIKNSFAGIVAQTVMVVSSFVCRMVFVRCLEEEYLGVNGLFSNVLSMLSLAELGIGSAIVYELYHALAYENDREIASLMTFYKKAYTIIGCAIGICGILVMPFLKYIVKMDSEIISNIYLLYLLYLLNTSVSYFFSYKSAIIEAAQCNYVVSFVHTLVIVTQNIVQCFILLIYKDFFLYTIIQVMFTVIYNIIISIVAKRMFPILKIKGEPLEKKQQVRMFTNIRALFITSVFGKLVGGVDNIIITALGGLNLTGLNSNYALLSQTLTGFTNKIQEGIRASVGNVAAVEDDKRKLELFDMMLFAFFWLYFWCTCCYILLVQDVITICFGSRYVMSFSIALITGINIYALEMSSVVGIFKNGMGLFRYGKYVTIFEGGINVLLSVGLGKYWGVEGILLATFIARILTEKWYKPYVTFKYGFHVSSWHYFKRDLRYWGEGIVIFWITYFLCELVAVSVWADLIYRAAICLIVPNSLIALLHKNEQEYNELKKKILANLKKNKKI